MKTPGRMSFWNFLCEKTMNMNLNREFSSQLKSLTNLWKKWQDTKLGARVRKEKETFVGKKPVAKKPKLKEKYSGYESTFSSLAAFAD